MANWIEIATFTDIPDTGAFVTLVNGLQVAVYKLDGELYAIEDRCTHMDFPISDGPVDADGNVMCIHHGAQFCIKTGAVVAPPAFDDLTTFPIKVQDAKVFIQL